MLFLLVDIRTTAKLFSLSEAIEKDEHDRKGNQRERETLRQQRADSNHSADKNVTHTTATATRMSQGREIKRGGEGERRSK